ncbi:hypothetical protein D9756_002668 [Leucocoprinus leucothites]|uniref:F-box domain-containing protein n=1 Tax=Leucocoprinus leucothites TaxID=201217 RepID=A0A8H5GBZ5_9AGAR|nr:hypothetical protein D9756_002668 [Leucoagaricus leucothites]
MSNSSEIDTVDLTSSTNPSHLVEKDAFASILAEAQRLESLHLYIERSELLQHLNSLRAVTRNLPAEILSLIFQDICSGEPVEDNADGEGDEEDEEDEEDIEERDEEGEGESEEEDSDESGDESDSDSDAFEFLPPFVALQLSAVCVRWRSVVQSTPSLWGEVHLVPLPGAINEEADLLSLVLRLSKQLPLVISFDFSQVPSRNTISSSYPEGLLLHPSVDEAIAENMHRFQNLNLCCPSTTWISAITHLSSRLVRLRIKTSYQQLPPDDGIEDLCLESCVGLRTLVLDKVFNKIRLPLNPAITDLVFNHMLSTRALQLSSDALIWCPHTSSTFRLIGNDLECHQKSLDQTIKPIVQCQIHPTGPCEILSGKRYTEIGTLLSCSVFMPQRSL